MMTPNYRYYKGESECPFKEGEVEVLFWNGEKTVADQPHTFEDFFNSMAPGDYPDWCKESGKQVDDWALATLVYNIIAKFYNGVDNLKWDEYLQKEPVAK